MAGDFRLGIQSYCFRAFKSIDQLIDSLKQVGLWYLELWPGHQPIDAPHEQIQRTLNAFRSSGIVLEAMGAVRFGQDEAEARKAFDFCRQASIKAITAMPAADADFDMIQRLCDEYDVNVAVHNHGRKHAWATTAELAGLLARTGPRIGVCLDTAWMLQAGEDPLAAAERFAERLYGVHLKDFVFDEAGRHKDVIIGTGGLDLPGLLTLLQQSNYTGYMSLEYEGDPDNPLPAIRQCVQAVQKAIAAL